MLLCCRFVTYPSKREALDAINEFDGFKIQGTRLIVRFKRTEEQHQELNRRRQVELYAFPVCTQNHDFNSSVSVHTSCARCNESLFGGDWQERESGATRRCFSSDEDTQDAVSPTRSASFSFCKKSPVRSVLVERTLIGGCFRTPQVKTRAETEGSLGELANMLSILSSTCLNSQAP